MLEVLFKDHSVFKMVIIKNTLTAHQHTTKTP